MSRGEWRETERGKPRSRAGRHRPLSSVPSPLAHIKQFQAPPTPRWGAEARGGLRLPEQSRSKAATWEERAQAARPLHLSQRSSPAWGPGWDRPGSPRGDGSLRPPAERAGAAGLCKPVVPLAPCASRSGVAAALPGGVPSSRSPGPPPPPPPPPERRRAWPLPGKSRFTHRLRPLRPSRAPPDFLSNCVCLSRAEPRDGYCCRSHRRY